MTFGMKMSAARNIEKKRAASKNKEKSYEEVMAPFWKEFEESGMTEEELDEFVEKLRQEIWDEKH